MHKSMPPRGRFTRFYCRPGSRLAALLESVLAFDIFDVGVEVVLQGAGGARLELEKPDERVVRGGVGWLGVVIDRAMLVAHDPLGHEPQRLWLIRSIDDVVGDEIGRASCRERV